MTTHQLPTWQVGDSVYALLLDPETGRWRVHGVGRVVRIEGALLHLETTKGPRTWGASEWPAFSSREAADVYVVDHPGPNWGREPMAHG